MAFIVVVVVVVIVPANVDSVHLRARRGVGAGLFVLRVVPRSWFNGAGDGM
jgi:hypothetical protein